MNPYEFTESMNEISGFGGSYERCCRAMVCAGALWCAAHPEADPKFGGYEGVFGLVREENEDARSLRRAIADAPFTTDDGRKITAGAEMTGAMFHATINHVFYIRHHGWNAYVEKMSEPLKIVEESEEESA